MPHPQPPNNRRHDTTPQAVVRNSHQEQQSPSAASTPVQENLLAAPLMTPARILYLQRTVGNRATQALLARIRTPPISHTPDGAHVQRLDIEDITDHYHRFRGEFWLQELLRRATEWENQAGDALEYAYRRRKAREIVNKALSQKFDSIVDPATPSDRPNTLKAICGNILNLLNASLPFDPVSALEQEIFLLGEYRRNKVFEFQKQIAVLPLNAQHRLAHLICTEIGFAIMEVLHCFPAIDQDASECIRLFEFIAVDHSLLHLDPDSRERCIHAFFGKGETLQQNLLLLKKENPTLALLIEPLIFSTEENRDLANLSEVGNYFGSPVILKMLTSVFKALEENRALHLWNSVLQLFADFLVRSGIDEEGLKTLQTTLPTILNQRRLRTRAELLQILIELLKADYEYEEAVERLEWMQSREQEESTDSDSDEAEDWSSDRRDDDAPSQRVEVSAVEKQPAYLKPICLSLLSLYPSCFDDQNVQGFLKQRELKRSRPDQHTVLTTLFTLRGCSLSAGQRQAVLIQLFDNIAKVNEYTEKIRIIGSISTCIKLHRTHQLLLIEDYAKLAEQLTSELRKVVGIKEELSKKDVERLQKHLRSIDHIIIYASTLNKLEDEGERKRALANLKAFVLSIMKKEYKRLRYGLLDPENLEKWKHLQTVLGIQTEALKEWMKGSGPNYLTFDYNGKSWLVMDTDAPATMLMIGSDFQTCQSINADVGMSKCLLSYMIDGKNRAIVVKRNDPKIPEKDRKPVARALFKVLWNPTRNTVVLFIEKLYITNEIDAVVAQEAILTMAKQRAGAIAQFINVDLVAEPSMAPDGMKSYPDAIHSLGGPAEFDYNDTQLQAGSPEFTIDARSTRLITEYRLNE